MIAGLGNILTKNKIYVELEKRCSKLVELTLDGTPITDASLDLMALHFKPCSSGGVFEVQVATWPHQRAKTMFASQRLLLEYLSSISSKGCKKVNLELLSAMPLILLFIDDCKILVFLHHESASSLLHAQLLLENCWY